MRVVDEVVLRVEVLVHELEQADDAVVHGCDEFFAAAVQVVVLELREPVGRVAGNAVDMRLDGQRADEASERVFNEELVAEDVVDHASADVGVAHPAAAIALGSVPDVVLHAEVTGVGAGFPDAVEERVRRFEGALVADGIIDVFEVDGFEAENGRTGEEADAGVAEGGFGADAGAVRR